MFCPFFLLIESIFCRDCSPTIGRHFYYLITNQPQGCYSFRQCQFTSFKNPIVNSSSIYLSPIIFQECFFNQMTTLCTGLTNMESFVFDRNCLSQVQSVSGDNSFLDVQSNSINFTFNTFEEENPKQPFAIFLNFNSNCMMITNINFTYMYSKTAVNLFNSNKTEDHNLLIMRSMTEYANLVTNHYIIDGRYKHFSVDYFNIHNPYISTPNYLFYFHTVEAVSISRINIQELYHSKDSLYIIRAHHQDRIVCFDVVTCTDIRVIGCEAEIKHVCTKTYFIEHLHDQYCHTQPLQLDVPKKSFSGKQVGEIIGVLIAGIAAGILIFVILFFAMKFLLKYIRNKRDLAHPVFELE